MKNLIILLVLGSIITSCSVLKPTPAAPVTTKVPNIMSRSIPSVPDKSIADAIATRTMRDSVVLIAKRMDTIIYNTFNTVRYQNKVIDTLWKRQGDYEVIIDSLVKLSKKNKQTIDEMNWIRFSRDFATTQTGDTTDVYLLKPIAQPATLGRSAASTIIYMASPSWLSYHSISERND